MKLFKISSIILFTFLGMMAIVPKAEAKSNFSVNLNLDARPRYYGYTYVERPEPVAVPVYAPCYVRPVYEPYYQPVVVERPYAERVYYQPAYRYR